MSSPIIKIDIKELDSEILDFDKRIEDLNKERNLKVLLKEYIMARYVDEVSINLSQVSQSISKGLNKDFSKDDGVATGVGQPTGISDFIRGYLSENKVCHTRDIGKAYAKHTDSPFDVEIKKQVSRALSRLKKSDQIENILRPGGKRAGSDWSLKANLFDNVSQ